ncbi:MAG TPA: DUF362 domain-containing protein, partial [Deltaproteobacteria bacterium]|nr:DUF362 domain-containing protein [Deltaproteobacteria bacterium]
MDRRTFLKLAAGAAAMAACPMGGGAHASPGGQRARTPLVPGPGAKVFLAGLKKGAGGEDIRRAVRSCAEAATDFSWLCRGDAVFIKPVINSGNPYPATTSPAAVAAMVGLLRERGAGRIIVGDMSGVEHVRFSADACRGSTRSLMESSGLAQAVKASGAELHCFEEAGWDAFHEEAPMAGSHWKKPLMMPAILKQVQHIVLMPRCGRHVLAGSTLGLKAAVGYWRHDTRLEYHRDASSFHEKTAEGNTVETLRLKQRLVVTAAHKVLTTFGPDRGHVYEPETGLIIASDSVLAHDMVSLAWLLENRRAMPDGAKGDYMDTSTIVPRVGNHLVVSWLSGWGQALASEGLAKNPLNAVWDDRVLTRASEVMGGVPG